MVKNGKIFETFCNENGALPHAGRQIQSLRMKEREKKKSHFQARLLIRIQSFPIDLSWCKRIKFWKPIVEQNPRAAMNLFSLGFYFDILLQENEQKTK